MTEHISRLGARMMLEKIEQSCAKSIESLLGAEQSPATHAHVRRHLDAYLLSLHPKLDRGEIDCQYDESNPNELVVNITLPAWVVPLLTPEQLDILQMYRKEKNE